jgi:hypothetical protein
MLGFDQHRTRPHLPPKESHGAFRQMILVFVRLVLSRSSSCEPLSQREFEVMKENGNMNYNPPE